MHAEPQRGDERPLPFSFLTDRGAFPRLPQIECHVTYTHPGVHRIIADNIKSATG